MRDPVDLYRSMARIRRFEEVADEYFAAGHIPGVLHLSIGQEAVAAGVCGALQPGDRITSTHRGHHHMVALGANVEAMYAELLARSTGCCGAKGGSMHIADIAAGCLGANGLVGGGIPLALGSALSSSILKDGAVSVAFFGDGAVNGGSFFESLNLAAVWRLPVVFVCENNLYTQFTVTGEYTAGQSIVDRAAVFGIAAQAVDATDILQTHRVAGAAVDAARAGAGPQFIEAHCFRIRGHTVGDEQILGGVRYRTDQELAEAAAHDPLLVAVSRGYIDQQTADALLAEEEQAVRRAMERAMQAPHPGAEDALLVGGRAV